MENKTLINPSYVEGIIKEIMEISGDDEMAHSLEDTLYQNIIAAIANEEIVDAKKCCELALKSADIDFARWCA